MFIDPNEYMIAQDWMFGRINNVNGDLVYVSLLKACSLHYTFPGFKILRCVHFRGRLSNERPCCETISLRSKQRLLLLQPHLKIGILWNKIVRVTSLMNVFEKKYNMEFSVQVIYYKRICIYFDEFFRHNQYLFPRK